MKKGLVFFDQMIVSGCNFMLGVLLVRWLGLESYGVFSILWMAIIFALSISQAIVSKPLLSLAPKKDEKKQVIYLNNLAIAQWGLGILLCMIAFIVWLVLRFGGFEMAYTTLIPYLAILIIFQLSHDFYRKRFFVQSNIIQAVLMDVILYVGQLVGIIICYYYQILTLEWVFYCLLIANVGSILPGLFSSSLVGTNQNNLVKLFKEHRDFSKWLLGTSLLQWFSGNYFIIVGAGILGPIAIGAVRIVQQIMGLCHILFLAMENFVPIEAARQYHLGSTKQLMAYLKGITLKVGAVFAFILLCLMGGSSFIIEQVYGSEYLPYSYLIPVFCLMYVFVFLGHPLRFALRTFEQTKPIFIAYIGSTIFSVIAAMPMLWYLDIAGLLAGLIITQIIAFCIYLIYLKKIVSHENYTFSTRKG